MNIMFVFEDGCGGSFRKDFRYISIHKNMDNIPASEFMKEILPKTFYDLWIDGTIVLTDHADKIVIDPDRRFGSLISDKVHFLSVHDGDDRIRILHALEKYREGEI